MISEKQLKLARKMYAKSFLNPRGIKHILDYTLRWSKTWEKTKENVEKLTMKIMFTIKMLGEDNSVKRIDEALMSQKEKWSDRLIDNLLTEKIGAVPKGFSRFSKNRIKQCEHYMLALSAPLDTITLIVGQVPEQPWAKDWEEMGFVLIGWLDEDGFQYHFDVYEPEMSEAVSREVQSLDNYEHDTTKQLLPEVVKEIEYLLHG